MDNPKFQQHGGGHAAEHPPHEGASRRLHHSPFFWIAFLFILLAMGIFIATDYFSILPAK